MSDVKERAPVQAPDTLRVASLISEVEDRVRQLRDFQQQNDQEVQQVRLKAAKLEASEAELAERARGLDARHAELKALQTQLESQRVLLDAQVTQVATQRNQLESQVQQAERSLETARRERADLDGLRERVAVAERELRAERQRTQEEWRSIEQHRRVHEALAAVLETERSRIQTVRDDLEGAKNRPALVSPTVGQGGIAEALSAPLPLAVPAPLPQAAPTISRAVELDAA